MPEVKVIGWTKYSEYCRDWFSEDSEGREQAELAVMNEIKSRGFKFGGNYHQNGEYGCPVMTGGAVFMVSMRHWGDIMATVWGGNYCLYAWCDVSDIEGGKTPSAEDYAEPSKYTAEELAQFQRKAEEETKKWIEEGNRRKSEMEEKERIDAAELQKYILEIISKHDGDKESLASSLAKDMMEVFERYRTKPVSANMKWALYEEERERFKEESSKRMKEFLSSIRDKMGEAHD